MLACVDTTMRFGFASASFHVNSTCQDNSDDNSVLQDFVSQHP